MAEWGGYSLLDEATKLKMAEQARGFTGGPTATSSGFNPTGTMPAIKPELTQFGAGLAAKEAAPEMDWKQQAMKALQDFSPLISQVGTSLMKGRDIRTGAPTETVGSQIGGAMTSALGTMKMNEALKKMITQQLSGGGGVGGGRGFSEGQPVGLTGAETVGLNPEQVKGLYSTGIELRAAELKRPVDNLAVISDAYLKVMSGEIKPAEMEKNLATAQKAYQDIAAAPIKNMVELMTKIQSMEKAQAEIAEIMARTSAIPAETAKKEAETKKTKAETVKTELESDPNYTAFKKMIENQFGGTLSEVRRGDRVSLTNPVTGAEVASYSVQPTPETGAKTATQELPLKKFAMQRIAPLVVRQLESEMAALPGGKNKVDLANLIASLRGYTGEIDPGVLIARASPELQNKFNKLMDIYVKTPGLSETEFGGIVQSILGAKSTEAPKVEKSTAGKSTAQKVIERAKPITAQMPTEGEVARFIAVLTGKKPAVWGIGDYRVTWDGSKITKMEPKKPVEAPSINFGTYTP